MSSARKIFTQCPSQAHTQSAIGMNLAVAMLKNSSNELNYLESLMTSPAISVHVCVDIGR